MKLIRVVMAAALACCIQVCVAQESAYASENSRNLSTEPSPLLVLKIGDEVTVLYPDLYETPRLNSIDSNWIKSIELIGPEESVRLYGKEGRDGAIVLEFKEGLFLARETLIRRK
ncbi:MAG: hypothetical protein DIU61_004145 [Bacteroidota bacterium]|jgi:hypothetical protein|nr:MAG: hypothetical protein DIU61_15165 [Bacteroidota bacterium]